MAHYHGQYKYHHFPVPRETKGPNMSVKPDTLLNVYTTAGKFVMTASLSTLADVFRLRVEAMQRIAREIEDTSLRACIIHRNTSQWPVREDALRIQEAPKIGSLP